MIRTSPVADPTSTPLHAYGMLLGAQVAIGSGGIFGRLALAGMGPVSMAAWRMALAAMPLVAYLLLNYNPRRIHWRQEQRLILAGCVLAAHFGLWAASLQRLPIGLCALLVCTSPVWNGLFELLIARRPLPRGFWWALLAAVGGIALIMVSAPPQGSWQSTAMGVAMGLASSCGTAAYLILVGRVSQVAMIDGGYSTLAIVTRTYGWAAVLLMVLSLVEARPPPNLFDGAIRPWLGILGLGVVTQGIGHTMQNAVLRHVRPTLVGFATLLEPLVATVLAAVLFGEPLTWRMIVGALIVLGAVAWPMRRLPVEEVETDLPVAGDRPTLLQNVS